MPPDPEKSLDELLQHSEYAEYQVLYTFDISKKTKVWQDGTLRFFKINKKLIVYDEAKIVAYEDFWRRYDTFEDQQELKFDEVWITIESLVGIYERDVRGQFHQLNASDVNAAAHIVSRPIILTTPVKQVPVTNHSSGKKRRFIGLRQSKGTFKSPLIKRQHQSTQERASTPVSLHIDRNYDTPIVKMKGLVTPPTSNKRTDKSLQKIRFKDAATTIPPTTAALDKVDVYDSDSQENDDLSEFDGNDDDDIDMSPNPQKRLFHKLEIGNEDDVVVTETWGHHADRSQKTKTVLNLSKRLLANQTGSG